MSRPDVETITVVKLMRHNEAPSASKEPREVKEQGKKVREVTMTVVSGR